MSRRGCPQNEECTYFQKSLTSHADTFPTSDRDDDALFHNIECKAGFIALREMGLDESCGLQAYEQLTSSEQEEYREEVEYAS